MTNTDIAFFIDRLQGWPREDLDELFEVARTIEASRAGLYTMNADERASVREGLDEARRGEFVPDREIEDLWTRLGA